MKISIADKRSDLNALTTLFVRNLTPDYISHSELQGPRALKPAAWVPNIEDVLRDEIQQRLREPLSNFPNIGKWNGVIEIYDNDRLIGLSFVMITHDAAVPFGTIEDIVIEQSARDMGKGTQVIEWILERFKKAGLKRAFLESGQGNRPARDLFERLGFKTISIVMAREL